MNILKGLLFTIVIFTLAFALTSLPVFFGPIGGVILLGIIFITLVTVFSFMNKEFFNNTNLTNYNKNDDSWYDEEDLISLSEYSTCNYSNQFCKHFLYGYCFKEDYDSCPHSK